MNNMEEKYVNVKLTWNTGYSKVVKMHKNTYDRYVRERPFITYKGNHSIDWASNDGKVGVSFNGLIAMEIVEGLNNE